MSKCKLILIRGLPGSGKSTFARDLQYLNTDLFHYESDNFLIEDGKYIWSPERVKNARQECFKGVSYLLNNNFSVIVSNCFISNKAIRKYTKLVNPSQLFIIEMDSQFVSIHNLNEKTFNNIKESYQSLEEDLEPRRIKFESTIYSERVLQVSRIIRKEV